jgi:hypothetical protein
MDKKSCRILTLTVGCMLLLSTTAQQAIAWPCNPPACPACYTCTETGCECQAQCGCGGRTCSGCCVCSGCSCVDDNSKCDPPYCEDCGCVPCWTLETGDPFQYGSCYCDDGTCEGELQTGYHHSCKRASSGSRECVYHLNQPIGWEWDCEASPDYLGIVECWLLNAGVCYIQCYAAWVACLECLGCWECTDAAMSCYDCLTGEGIYCGCLVITCVPSEKPSGTYYGGDNILQGGSCPE